VTAFAVVDAADHLSGVRFRSYQHLLFHDPHPATALACEVQCPCHGRPRRPRAPSQPDARQRSSTKLFLTANSTKSAEVTRMRTRATSRPLGH
jgi:hypothetical protein